MTTPTILVVDDDRSIVKLCQRLLERASFQVLASTDPFEALKILEVHRVDLLLTDIRMPVMDGFELIERGKALQPDLAVLVMTGFGTVDTAIQALYRGVDGLILKPFENTAGLVEAVQRVLTYARQKQEAARAQVLKPLFDITETLLAETSLKTLEKLIQNAIIGIFQCEYVGVIQREGQGRGGNLVVGHMLPRQLEKDLWEKIFHFLVEHDSTPILIHQTGPGDTALQKILRSAGWSSLMVTFINRGGREFIFLAGRSSPAQPYTSADLDLFTMLARQAAVALENARLYTDLKDYVRRVEESQQALVQAEKMAAVGRLVASLAHEINNPLQSLQNCLHLALRADLDPEQRSHYLNMTETELNRLIQTVRRMLEFYRPSSHERTPIRLAKAVQHVLDLMRSEVHSRGVEVAVHIPEEVEITGLEDQIQQVFFNLVLNAMDAVEECETKRIWIECVSDEKDWVITVEDSGRGVPPDIKDRIFEPFISTKKNGTGLGLAVSYGIIEAHGGTLALIPGKYGQGACFEIRFPKEEEMDA